MIKILELTMNFMFGVYNDTIGDGKKIKVFPIEKMWGLGTPEDLERYVNDFNIS